MKEIILEKDERLDDLECNNLHIIQKTNLYCFSSDAVLLANNIKATVKDTIVDFGTGSGVIAILASAKTNAKKIIGIEIQSIMAKLAQKNVVLNNLENKIEILNKDIKDAYKYIGKESVKVVVCNPPYFKKGSGDISERKEISISRTESSATLNDIIESASSILKYSGKLYMIHKSERLAEVMSSLVKYSLEPKKLTLIYPKRSKKVDTFVIEAQKNGAPGLVIEDLVVYEENGQMTDVAKKLYNKI